MPDASGRQFEPRLWDAFVELIDDLQAIRDEFPDSDDERRVGEARTTMQPIRRETEARQ